MSVEAFAGPAKNFVEAASTRFSSFVPFASLGYRPTRSEPSLRSILAVGLVYELDGVQLVTEPIRLTDLQQ